MNTLFLSRTRIGSFNGCVSYSVARIPCLLMVYINYIVQLQCFVWVLSVCIILPKDGMTFVIVSVSTCPNEKVGKALNFICLVMSRCDTQHLMTFV